MLNFKISSQKNDCNLIPVCWQMVAREYGLVAPNQAQRQETQPEEKWRQGKRATQGSARRQLHDPTQATRILAEAV